MRVVQYIAWRLLGAYAVSGAELDEKVRKLNEVITEEGKAL